MFGKTYQNGTGYAGLPAPSTQSFHITPEGAFMPLCGINMEGFTELFFAYSSEYGSVYACPPGISAIVCISSDRPFLPLINDK